MLEIHVDVGWLFAFAGDKAFEEQGALNRIDLGNTQGVAHHRVGRRAAALAQDLLTAGEADDVFNGEKEGFVAELVDQGEFGFGLGAHCSGHRIGAVGPWRIASSKAFAD